MNLLPLFQCIPQSGRQYHKELDSKLPTMLHGQYSCYHLSQAVRFLWPLSMPTRRVKTRMGGLKFSYTHVSSPVSFRLKPNPMYYPRIGARFMSQAYLTGC